jgi:hypothetical protein
VAANMGEAARLAHEAWDRVLTLGQAPVETIKDAALEIQKNQ